MTPKRKTHLSKFISLILRHEPQAIGLELGPEGWVRVDALLAGMNGKGESISLDELQEIVATSEKKRFAFSDDGLLIRANQGHSVDVEITFEKATPPEILFHGTATRFLESIRAKGLQKQNRQHVHLSADEATAIKVGQRHGTPIVLRVRAERMNNAGFSFYIAPNGVWLTDSIPPEFLEFPS